jgi:hypothetical protein
LAGVVTRAPWYEEMSGEFVRKQFETDLVDSSDASMFANKGSATRLRWDFGRESAPSEEHVNNLVDSAVISHALIQLGQLRLLERLSLSRNRGEKSMALAEGLLVYGLQEVNPSVLSFGTAQVVASYIANELGVPEMYMRIRERLDVVRQVNSFAHGRSVARRTNKISAVALLVAAIVALPNLNDGLQAISQIDVSEGRPIFSAVHDFAAMGPRSAVVLFVLLVATVLLVLLPRPRLRRPKRLRRKVVIGMRWPYQNLEVVMRNDGPGGVRGRRADVEPTADDDGSQRW